MENRLLDIDNKTKNTSAYRYRPVFRRLRGYAFDPSLSTRVEMADVNLVVFKIRWEEKLDKGPIGEYVEVVDIDPASQVFYEPVDLNDKYILAIDGLPPSESNPQFHQQMVYAVAMTTIEHFEKGLGRKVMWSSIDYQKQGHIQKYSPERFVQRLRLYPHAIREANAYYSPEKKAVLFGYFVARPADETTIMPGTLVFTCLSHDIIAHEVTHAIIDGQHRQYVRPMTVDTLALHEAFSDIVALFQHFTFQDVLKSQISKTRGSLESQNLLGELAQQLGLAIGTYESLRSALGKKNKDDIWELTKPNPQAYKTQKEPHERGSILVATVFRAFLKIYKKRTSDLFRIATDGTGILPAGEIHPDLVNRLASEASLSAKHVLSMCIRALDYCPPVRVTFGDFLRAIITADYDLILDDDYDYRLAFIESFKEWGIYPKNIFSLSEESLIYKILNRAEIENYLNTDDFFQAVVTTLADFDSKISRETNRERIFKIIIKSKLEVHRAIRNLMIVLNDELLIAEKSGSKNDKKLKTDYEVKKMKLEGERFKAQTTKISEENDVNIKEKRLELISKKSKAYNAKYQDLREERNNIEIKFHKEISRIVEEERKLAREFAKKRVSDVKYKVQVLKELSGFLVPILDPEKLILIEGVKENIQPSGTKTECFLEVSLEQLGMNDEQKKYLADYKIFLKINKRIADGKETQYYPNFQVYNLNYALRVGPDNVTNKQVVLSLLQDLYLFPQTHETPTFNQIVNLSLVFRGGSTLILSADKPKLKYSIVKKVDDVEAIIDFIKLNTEVSHYTTPFALEKNNEPFAILHRGY